MNKTGIKNYAIQARKDLIKGVQLKAFDLGITQDKVEHNTVESNETFVIHGRILSQKEKKQRESLLQAIHHKGYTQVMEEVAYTWFNRFCALRYMEVNHYLPTRVRVFTNTENEFKPEILKEVLELGWNNLDQKEVIRLLESNQEDQLYRYLLITQCNDMHRYLPGMFEKLDDYTEALLPEGLLRPGSVLDQMIEQIPEDDWKEQVEIIGWLYQFYYEEPRRQIIDVFKPKAIKREEIPAATQLFTPDWIVRYMVDNSLGKYWIERNPSTTLREKLEYFVHKDINYLNERIDPTEIKFFDPCMGSGHILVYAFDVFMHIYEECGYTKSEAAKSIIEKNIYGIDIDDRAYQLAYFALLMRAHQYNRTILRNKVNINIVPSTDLNGIDDLDIKNLFGSNKELSNTLIELKEQFKDVKDIGSLLLVDVNKADLEELKNYINEDIKTSNLFNNLDLDTINQFIKQVNILSKKYNIVSTNPPYLNKFNSILKDYLQKKYKDYSSDLFSAFMFRNINLTVSGGYSSFMTPFVWMFIKSYEDLRKYIINNKNISSLIQLEYSAFEEATVPICTFVLENTENNKEGVYIRLSDFVGGMEVQRLKILEAIHNNDCPYLYSSKSDKFRKIPGSPIAYWASKKNIEIFSKSKSLLEIVDIRQGLATTDNKQFLRNWHEVSIKNIGFKLDAKSAKESEYVWFPYNKGGEFRKWYGNIQFIVNYYKDGEIIKRTVKEKYRKTSYAKNFTDERWSKLIEIWVVKNQEFYFRESISWSLISSSSTSFRYYPQGFVFDVAGMSCFSKNTEDMYYLVALNNSKVVEKVLSILAPTINFQVGDIANIPVVENNRNRIKTSKISKQNIAISQTDWDSFETSWDFKQHPMLVHKGSTVEASYESWKQFTYEQFAQLKANEEELNRIFIEIYGLEDELTPEVDDKDITITRITDVKSEDDKKNRYSMDKTEVIKTFVSYAVGCMFGRYSLDEEGLICAGGDFDVIRYQSYPVDTDNIIPISDDEYFNDDISNRFVKFVDTVYGSEGLEGNLKFIADALGSRGITSREVIRNYFLNDFYKDHVKMYQKKPIYWLFDSGKKNGFKALVYLHRYQSDLLAKMRVDYVHQQQERYRSQIEHTQILIDQAESSKEKINATNQYSKLIDQERELKGYEEKLKHMADMRIEIDLDDGVTVNYAKFEGLVSPIK